MWWPWPLTLQFPEMLNTTPVSLFDWKKFVPGLFVLSFGSKTTFKPTFGHVVTLTSKFQKCITLPQIVLLSDESFYQVYLNGVVAPKLYFCPYLVMWCDSNLSTSNFQKYTGTPIQHTRYNAISDTMLIFLGSQMIFKKSPWGLVNKKLIYFCPYHTVECVFFATFAWTHENCEKHVKIEALEMIFH